MNQTPKARRVEYASFDEFYHFYLGEHENRTCRRLHFIGTTLALLLALAAVFTGIWWLLAVAFVQGYAWAWVGHFKFEHNRPATFTYPIRSYLGDWRMWWDTLRGRIRF